MDAFLAFLGENKAIVALLTGVVALLTAMLASGGAGTLLLKRLLGERERPDTKPSQSYVIKAKGKGIGFINTGDGTVDIQQSRAAAIRPVESARGLQLPHETTQEAVRRLKQQGVGRDALEDGLAGFASRWHQERERVDRLAAADALDAATADALENALCKADLEAVDRLCRPLEGARRHDASADGTSG